jgi:hypothetical protein
MCYSSFLRAFSVRSPTASCLACQRTNARVCQFLDFSVQHLWLERLRYKIVEPLVAQVRINVFVNGSGECDDRYDRIFPADLGDGLNTIHLRHIQIDQQQIDR